MTDTVRETMDGTLGHFWTDLNDVYKLNKSSDGYVRLGDDSLFHLGTLRTQEFNRELRTNRERLPRPEAIYAMTGSTRSIFFDIAGVSRSNVMGPRASTQTIRTRGVVVDVPFTVLENKDFTEVEVWILEVTLWSCLQGVSEQVELYDDKRPKGYTASTVHVEPLTIDIRRGLKLVLDTTWSVEGPLISEF
jgi:ApeA N-terminal domain 1